MSLFAAWTIVALLGVLVHAASSQAAPTNDDFANATSLSGSSVETSGSTVDATIQANEPDHNNAGTDASVWYRWQAPRAGRVNLNTCGGGAVSAVGVYTGNSLTDLTNLASGGCKKVFWAISGVVYRIAIGSRNFDEGPFTLDLDLHPTPANDDFANAKEIPGNSTRVGGTTIGATLEPYELDEHLGRDTVGSVWYSWQAPRSGTARFDACQSGNAVTGIGAYTGTSLAGLTTLGTGRCQVTFSAQQGVTYRLTLVAKNPWVADDLILELGVYQAPANDNFASAASISGSPAVVTGTTLGATLEPDELNHGYQDTKASVWYSWTPAQSGTAVVNACNDDDTVQSVAAYTGAGLISLNEVASNHCLTSFPAVAGTTYRIAVSSHFGSWGGFTLNASLHQPPANDNFAAAQVVGGNSAVVAGSTLAATLQPNEPDHDYHGNTGSVWYSWTPTQSGAAIVDACSNSTDSVHAIAAYTGAGLNSGLTEQASGYCRITFPVTGGTTYRIAVGSHGSNAGDFTLKVSLPQPPANDNFAASQLITGNSAVVTGSTMAATFQLNEPNHYGEGTDASVWYSWAPTQSGTAIVNACSDGTDSVHAIAAYTGTGLNNLTEQASDYCRTSFPVTGGTTYRIAVSSYGSGAGDFSLDVSVRQPPVNDNFAAAQVVGGNSAVVTGSTVAATVQANEPDHDYHGISASVWYSWTPTQSGTAVINACDNDTDSVHAIAAYTGAGLNSGLTKQASDFCRISFPVSGGTTYRIAVGSHGEFVGDFSFDLSLYQPPANDDFAAAQVIGGNSVEVAGSSLAAGHEPGEPSHNKWGSGTASVWYSWTAPKDGSVSVDVCDSSFSPVIAAYTGSSVTGLTRAKKVGDSCRVNFQAVSDTTYHFAVDGSYDGDSGILALKLLFGPADGILVNRLSVATEGGGQGRVTSSPGGVDCGSDCSETYLADATVTLTATPENGSAFTGWAGACTGAGTCTVTMDELRAVTATFVRLHTLSVTVTGPGQGKVTSGPAGIDCGADCSETYPAGTSVTLTATAGGDGAIFDGWSGACSGADSTCQVTMSEARSVTATFGKKDPLPSQSAPKVGKVSAPKKSKIKRGKQAVVKVKVKNVGGKTLTGKLRIKSSNKQVKVPKSAKLNVKPGKAQTIKVKVKAGKKAKGKAKITFSAGGKKAVTTLTVKK